MSKKSLNDIALFSRGLTYKKIDIAPHSSNIVLRANNIKYEKNNLVLDDLVYIKDSLELNDLKKIKKGSTLMCISSGSKKLLGKSAFIDKDYNYYFGAFLGMISPKENIYPKYLFYLLNSKKTKDHIFNLTDGMGINNLKFDDIKNLKFLVPSFSNQKRIVEKLDTCMEQIDKAIQNVEQNIQNAEELFQSKLNEIFSQKGDNWEVKKLGDVCKTGAGGTPLKRKKEYYKDGKIPWLVSGEIKQGDIFHSKNFITQKGLDNSSAKLFPRNTVLIAMYGATAGDIGILRFESSTNQAVCGILPNQNFLPKFLSYTFLYRKKELVSKATGSAQPNISQIKIKNTLIPVLSIKLQTEIVQRLDVLKEYTESVKLNFQQEINALNELKMSILQKAFYGEL